MPTIKIYHNPNFLDYWGNHTNVVPPIRPVATVQVPETEKTPIEQALEIAYRQTQHLDDVDGGWWNRKSVMLHIRSTSVGDVLADEQGNLFVVESVGFGRTNPEPFVPTTGWPKPTGCSMGALAQASTGQITAMAMQARNTILHVLEAEGYPSGEVPILSWDNAQPGDLVGSPDIGLFRVIARKLRPKWRAKRLLTHIPNAQVWIDSPRTWAVLVPVTEETS